jgi:hypothetical protein
MRELSSCLLCCARVRCSFSWARPRAKSAGQTRFACKTTQKLAGSRMAQAMASRQGPGICQAGTRAPTRGAWPAMVRARLALITAVARLSTAVSARRNEASGDASEGREREQALARDCCKAEASASAAARGRRAGDPGQEIPRGQGSATRGWMARMSSPGQARMPSTTGPNRRPWRRGRG